APPRHGIALEFLQVNVEVGERAVADLGGSGTDFLVIAELGYAVGAPAHEVALQPLQRRLEVGVGELGARRRLEVHGRYLHEKPKSKLAAKTPRTPRKPNRNTYSKTHNRIAQG